MTKPVLCGCGGKPKIDADSTERIYIYCSECCTLTSGLTYGIAVERWNRAMSGNRVRLHHIVLADEERLELAKPYKIDGDSNRWHCGVCNTAVGRFWVYCQKCGTPIDWSVRSESGQSD